MTALVAAAVALVALAVVGFALSIRVGMLLGRRLDRLVEASADASPVDPGSPATTPLEGSDGVIAAAPGQAGATEEVGIE